ncbi:hypothetical protein BCV70DRAFT_8445 [Testicularia cyperi]|uniref:Uncharacterized protein n=1 Tax=Testicularia cyperi TaxID=1882483 RepID=A0A317XX78_9BASI|nr:hypothetical protein BCV70DRAFT_8445 [Testicularia cyperi]
MEVGMNYRSSESDAMSRASRPATVQFCSQPKRPSLCAHSANKSATLLCSRSSCSLTSCRFHSLPLYDSSALLTARKENVLLCSSCRRLVRCEVSKWLFRSLQSSLSLPLWTLGNLALCARCRFRVCPPVLYILVLHFPVLSSWSTRRSRRQSCPSQQSDEDVVFA